MVITVDVAEGPQKKINDWHDSRAITVDGVGGWWILTLQVPAPNVHHGVTIF